MELLTRPEDAAAIRTHARPSDTGHDRSLSERLDFLDGLRALACLSVVLHHLVSYLLLFATPQIHSGKFAHHLLLLTVFGRLAVAVFIVISGFCLMLPVIRNDGELAGGARRFFAKRARRVLPPYFAAVVLALLLLPNHAGKWDIVRHLFLVHNVNAAWVGTLNGVFWTLAVECQIYLWFPLLVWAWRRFGATRLVSVILPGAILGAIASENTSWFWLKPHFYLLFTLGMLAAAISCLPRPHWTMVRTRVPWGTVTASLGATLLLCIFNKAYLPVHEHINCFELLAGLFAFSLLVTLARPEAGRLRRPLESRPLTFIGAFSYSIYLVHPCFVHQIGTCFRQYCWIPLHLSPGKAYLILAPAGVPLILAASYLFYLAFERPFFNRHRPRRRPYPGLEVPPGRKASR